MESRTDTDPPMEGPPTETETDETATTSVIAVPGHKRPPLSSLQGSFIWLYGPQKIGKTTLAAQFPGAWFWVTEPGQNFVEVYPPLLIQDWPHFLDICDFVRKERPTKFGDGQAIKTLVIDTTDLLYKMCEEYVCQGLGIEDPGELDHGKGWSRLSKEFERVITGIRRWPYTLVCISHARQREFKTRGTKKDRWEPDIGVGGARTLSSAADLTLYCYSEETVQRDEAGNITGTGEERLMLCRPTSWATAGGRMADRLPDALPMDYQTLVDFVSGKRKLEEPV